jgi:DNA invertase Pin-like site-specific DNA recombinase
LAAQEVKIRAYCVAKDWDLLHIIRDEGCSAKDLNRPGMQTIIEGAKKQQFDVVVTLKLDRLTRSVKDLGYLVEDVFSHHGVAFSSLQDNFDTSTANGRMVMNILATIAQWERDIISERTRDAMQFMKQGLKLVGAVPLSTIPSARSLRTMSLPSFCFADINFHPLWKVFFYYPMVPW